MSKVSTERLKTAIFTYACNSTQFSTQRQTFQYKNSQWCWKPRPILFTPHTGVCGVEKSGNERKVDVHESAMTTRKATFNWTHTHDLSFYLTFYMCTPIESLSITEEKKRKRKSELTYSEREKEKKKKKKMQNWFSTFAWCVHFQFFFISLLHFVVLIMLSWATFNSMGKAASVYIKWMILWTCVCVCVFVNEIVLANSFVSILFHLLKRTVMEIARYLICINNMRRFALEGLFRHFFSISCYLFFRLHMETSISVFTLLSKIHLSLVPLSSSCSKVDATFKIYFVSFAQPLVTGCPGHNWH